MLQQRKENYASHNQDKEPDLHGQRQRLGISGLHSSWGGGGGGGGAKTVSNLVFYAHSTITVISGCGTKNVMSNVILARWKCWKAQKQKE